VQESVKWKGVLLFIPCYSKLGITILKSAIKTIKKQDVFGLYYYACREKADQIMKAKNKATDNYGAMQALFLQTYPCLQCVFNVHSAQ
jgi:hypothetical protein